MLLHNNRPAAHLIPAATYMRQLAVLNTVNLPGE